MTKKLKLLGLPELSLETFQISNVKKLAVSYPWRENFGFLYDS